MDDLILDNETANRRKQKKNGLVASAIKTE